MSGQTKEWIGAALLGDLLVELGRSEAIRRLLGEIGEGRGPDFIKELVGEFERILEERRQQSDAGSAGAVKREARSKAVPFEIHLKAPDPLQASVPRKASPGKSVAEPIPSPRPPQPAPEAKAARPSEAPAPRPPAAKPPMAEPLPPSKSSEEPDGDHMASPRNHVRTPYDQSVNEPLYVHAVAFVPADEEPSRFPFMLEAKGIEGKEFVFAIDHGRFRFYLSKISTESMNVSRTGMLLFNKADSIRYRGVHESTLNELRAHSILLPFTFGTVVFGKEDLIQKSGANVAELEEALDELARTTWWDLQVFALDSRMAQLVAVESPAARREQDRARLSFSAPAQAKRIDIKTLERILSKQKKLAESVHEDLKPLATRSDVDMLIDLGGGSSEDWKPILKASYEVLGDRLHSFNSEIASLQYRHFLFELMLMLRGEREEFQFS